VNVAEARQRGGAGEGGPAPGRRSDAELDEVTLRRAQRGEPAACRALVERYQRPVFALLHRMLGPARRDRVEDLAQETFLGVFRALSRFAPLGSARLSTWILTIAARRAVDEMRRSGEEADLDAGGALDRRSGGMAAAERAAGEAAAAESAVWRAELAARVARAVASLSPEQRAAFLLREYHGFEYAEIGRALDIDLGTVKSRLARARAALREALRDLLDRGDREEHGGAQT
jgi:RNA polymerase sigma-70 factor (ECF subfamily)